MGIFRGILNSSFTSFRQWAWWKKGLLFMLLVIGVLYGCCLPKSLFDVPYSVVVTDRQGELLHARIASDGQWRFPPRHSVPQKVEQCLITFEDRRFYHHFGVSIPAMMRALWQNVKNRRVVSGGSTLTMQVMRLSRNRPRTLGEKLIEMVLATRLEFRYSKKEILALYASYAPFGGNVVGIDAAAWRYFAHSADELSWAEAALLAVLPNAPSLLHLSKGRDELLKKRNRLLNVLHERGTIDASTWRSALEEPLPQKPHPLPQIASHIANHLPEDGNVSLYTTTIDKSLQLQVEGVAEQWSREFRRSEINHLAVLVLDLQKNEVLAYVGNTGYKQGLRGSQVDIIHSPRSTGSILKPFLYAAMLQDGLLLPRTLLPDVPININGFTPQNFSRQYEGAVPASEALARSLNIPFVVALQRYGVPNFHDLLQRMGLTTLTRPAAHYGLSLILGGAEGTLWDIVNAYAALGRSVLHLPMGKAKLMLAEPVGITSPLPEEVIHAGAAWQTLDVLTEVNRPEDIDLSLLTSVPPVSWKTGTSYGFRDAWAVGVTPRYVVGVWVGNAGGEGRPELSGARTAGPVMFHVLNLLPTSRTWFPRPEGVFVDAEVCALSGHLKGRYCDHTDSVLILPAGRRTESCPYHHPVMLTKDGTHRVFAGASSGGEADKRTVWFTLPPAWEWYYRRHHPEYQPLPPLLAGSGEDFYRPMQFIYPTPNAEIFLPKQLDGSEGYLTAELAHSRPDVTVYWHLDNEYMGETQYFHKLSLRPSPGWHTLVAVDGDGNTLSTRFKIVDSRP